MLVRRRRDDDLPELVSVLREVHESDGYPVRASAAQPWFLRIEPGALAWVADVEGHAVGHVVMTPAGADMVPAPLTDDVAAYAVVGRLFVAAAARASGCGRALLDTACAAARSAGWSPVLEVVEGSAAVGWYERLGWRQVTSVRSVWTDDCGAHRVLRWYRL